MMSVGHRKGNGLIQFAPLLALQLNPPQQVTVSKKLLFTTNYKH